MVCWWQHGRIGGTSLDLQERVREYQMGRTTRVQWLTRHVGGFDFREAVCFLKKGTMFVRIKLRVCERAFCMMRNGRRLR